MITSLDFLFMIWIVVKGLWMSPTRKKRISTQKSSACSSKIKPDKNQEKLSKQTELDSERKTCQTLKKITNHQLIMECKEAD